MQKHSCSTIYISLPLSSLSLWSSNIAFAVKKCRPGFHCKRKSPGGASTLHSHIFQSALFHIWFHLKHIQLNINSLVKNTLHGHCAAGIPFFFILLYPQPKSVVCSHDHQKPLIRYHGNSSAFHVFDSLSLKSSV